MRFFYFYLLLQIFSVTAFSSDLITIFHKGTMNNFVYKKLRKAHKLLRKEGINAVSLPQRNDVKGLVDWSQKYLLHNVFPSDKVWAPFVNQKLKEAFKEQPLPSVSPHQVVFIPGCLARSMYFLLQKAQKAQIVIVATSMRFLQNVDFISWEREPFLRKLKEKWKENPQLTEYDAAVALKDYYPDLSITVVENNAKKHNNKDNAKRLGKSFEGNVLILKDLIKEGLSFPDFFFFVYPYAKDKRIIAQAILEKEVVFVDAIQGLVSTNKLFINNLARAIFSAYQFNVQASSY